MLQTNKDRKVSVEDQGKVARMLRKLESKQSKTLTTNPKDLMYAAALIEHCDKLQETGGHLYKLFQPGPLSIENYSHHKAFFDATATHKEVLFRAANRVGKSVAGAYCGTCWATGLYPDWWEGRVFDKQTKGWVCGDTNDTVRTILQEKLLGQPFGTGLIPAESLLDVVIRPNTGGTVDTIYVKNENGKTSRMKMKTYQSGAESFYGDDPDWGWMDEEPGGKDAQLIWNQMYMRLLTTNGSLLITFTPLLGWTPLVRSFSETAVDLTPGEDD
jgi:phage terminase large subunit-like protein